MSTGLLGGAFDPPHNGHVAIARGAEEQLGLDPLVVLVVAAPGHKDVYASAKERLQLARAAFPSFDVELDDHARTVDLLREGRWNDPALLIGADELADFLGWKEPDEVLERSRLAVASRPGYPRERLEAVLAQLRRPDRVLFFEIQPHEESSTEIRERVARGEPIDGLVPPAVAAEIDRLGLYR